MDLLEKTIAVAALVFGFGFVVFFHELGHFLAAKWVGIKVEQFAVGFGHALLAWRKGIGVRVGSTQRDYEAKAREYLQGQEGLKQTHELAEAPNETRKIEIAAKALGLGETEYRLNWLPLGGYVKMLGQDDMNPNAQIDDPRAYNRKSISARMLVVSAGVIMNIILAAILFMAVFLIGYDVPPALVGSVAVNSPAQKAGLQIGDRIRWVGDDYQHDFHSLTLSTALADPNAPIPVKVERGGQTHTLMIRPERDASGFLVMGVRPMEVLHGLDPKEFKLDADQKAKLEARKNEALFPGDVIVAVDGQPVNQKPKLSAQEAINDYLLFDQKIQASAGKPVPLTVRDKDGKERPVLAEVTIAGTFGDTQLNFAGLRPRPVILGFSEGSPAEARLKEDDVIVRITINDSLEYPSIETFYELVAQAGADKKNVDFLVERDGKRLEVTGLTPSVRTGRGKRGLGVSPGLDLDHPIIAEVPEKSAAGRAKIPKGALIEAIDGQSVKNWFDIHRLLKAGGPTSKLTFVELDAEGKPIEDRRQTVELKLEESEQQFLSMVRYTHELVLDQFSEPRKTNNPLTAMSWGVVETRDLLLQFYLTLARLFQGSVSVTNFMGPIGIVHAGSMFAFRGWDWLIWFLAMISANLAVVNFLPIPIVDGGLFTFLIVEKVQGKPLSPRMQTVAQLVGLAIILSVFLLVTYQDIARLWL